MKKPFIIASLVFSSVFFVATTLQTTKGTINLDDLFNYANQDVPSYITKDNTPADNPISDVGATLGRVLFYDKKLSSDNTISCASCHHQEFAFSDADMQSTGVNDITPRHSMRLINARFADEGKFFWDERAGSLEEQTSMPIQDHGEMGFSGTNGDPDFSDLVDKLHEVDYYEPLFTAAFGDAGITEERIQKAISQFIRSIQSFDSKYDEGRAQASSDLDDFPNYTNSENAGKALFMGEFEYVKDTLTVVDDTGGTYVDSVAWRSVTSPGLGCASCHRPPEFDIDPNSLSNGKVRDITNTLFEYGITRAPTLRDVLGSDGSGNGPFFHSGLGAPDNNITAMVFEHYNRVRAIGDLTEYDPRILPEGKSMYLNLTGTEQMQLRDFIETLTGSDVYTNEKWSNPFDDDGNLVVIGDNEGDDSGDDGDGSGDDDDSDGSGDGGDGSGDDGSDDSGNGGDDSGDDGGSDDSGDGGDDSDDTGSDDTDDDTDQDEDEEPLSSSELAKFSFEIHPNPTKGAVSIETDVANYYVELANIQGQRINSYENVSTIDLRSFKDGMYLIRIKDEEGEILSTQRIIKVK